MSFLHEVYIRTTRHNCGLNLQYLIDSLFPQHTEGSFLPYCSASKTKKWKSHFFSAVDIFLLENSWMVLNVWHLEHFRHISLFLRMSFVSDREMTKIFFLRCVWNYWYISLNIREIKLKDRFKEVCDTMRLRETGSKYEMIFSKVDVDRRLDFWKSEQLSSPPRFCRSHYHNV